MQQANRVTFNIGGTRYEVSRTVVNMFPADSMLAKICSETWSEGSDDEIFIDRNGQRFQYVLDYLRDGSVQLPLSIPRSQLIVDLDYYGIAYTDESISLSVSDGKDLFKGLIRYMELEKAEVEKDFKAAAARKVAYLIAKEFLHDSLEYPRFKCSCVSVNIATKVELEYFLVEPHLNKFGLSLKNNRCQRLLFQTDEPTGVNVVSLLKPVSTA